MKTVPDKCPFCESPIIVHGGNLLRSADGGFASYECKTVQDIELSDDEWKRAGQSEPCRKREVQLLTIQRDEARERIKRLEEELERTKEDRNAIAKNTREPLLLKLDHANERISKLNDYVAALETAGDLMANELSYGYDVDMWNKAKEAKP